MQDKHEEFDPVSFYVIKTEADRTQKITERSEAKGENVVIAAAFSEPQECTLFLLSFPFPNWKDSPCLRIGSCPPFSPISPSLSCLYQLPFYFSFRVPSPQLSLSQFSEFPPNQ